MVKYILKENELSAMIQEIVSEELSDMVSEGLLHVLGTTAKNVAKTGAMGVAAPMLLADRGFTKLGKIVNGNDTMIGAAKDFFGIGGGTGTTRTGGKNDTKGKNGNGNSKNGRQTANETRRNYGEPETRGGLGRRLEERMDIIVHDFLGSGEDVNFGRHYWERNQDETNSVWSRRLRRAGEGIQRARDRMVDHRRIEGYIRQYERDFRRWLRDRDRAYEQYIREIRNQR